MMSAVEDNSDFIGDTLKEQDEEDIFIELLYNCKYCKFQTKNLDKLDVHSVSHNEAFLEDNLPEKQNGTPDCPENELGGHLLDYTNDFKFSIIPPSHQRATIQPSEQPTNYSIISSHKSVDKSQDELKDEAGKAVFVCPFCKYTNSTKLIMESHIKKHREPIEVPVYACSECSYTTVRKSDMTKHLLTHVKDGNGPKYECDRCSYTTIKKWCLQKHMLCHKHPDEVQMYSCSHCPYSTKRRSDLKKHMLTHENNSTEGNSDNLSVYRCSYCPYKSIKKWCLQKHMFRHKKPEEIEMHFCDQCTFFTNRRNSLKKHLLTHKNNSDLP